MEHSAATPLERIPFDDAAIREGWIQDLLYRHPTLLPIDEIEEVFGPLIPLARELEVGPGAVDVAFINPSGFITLVETKLFRNPEARRKVVAQLLDYASAMSRWSYEDLRDAVGANRRARAVRPQAPQPTTAVSADPLIRLVQDEPDFDERVFVDYVNKNLARGRFLLLIAGDGIQEGTERLVETFAAAPHLGFTMALLELGLFRAGGDGKPLFVQPRVLTRTREVTRAVIELRAGLTPADVRVTLPAAEANEEAKLPTRLTEQVMFEGLSAALDPSLIEQFRRFLAQCEKLGIEAEAKSRSITLTWYDSTAERPFSFGNIYAEGGRVDLRFVRQYYRSAGLDPAMGTKYINAVSAIVPGSIVKEHFVRGEARLRVFLGDREINLADLMPHAESWLAALASVTDETERACAKQIAT